MTDEPTIDENGTLHIPGFDLPVSAAISDQGKAVALRVLRAHVKDRVLERMPRALAFASEDAYRRHIDAFRLKQDAESFRPRAEAWMKIFPVDVQKQTMGGVSVDVVTPQQGVAPENAGRVLIDLHGGGFFGGAGWNQLIESVPVAGHARIRVVSVDYRQGYEHKFPAASEDVAAVYATLLQQYPARNIGIFGGSAGATLTAQATTWIIDKGMPAPGAIWMGSGGGGGDGDSQYLGLALLGYPVTEAGARNVAGDRSSAYGYFAGVDPTNYLAYPVHAGTELLGKFPPTLLTTGTRAFDASSVINTHRKLCQAGVDAQLHLWDGLWHCFHYFADLPEAREAIDTAARFFQRHLDR